MLARCDNNNGMGVWETLFIQNNKHNPTKANWKLDCGSICIPHTVRCMLHNMTMNVACCQIYEIYMYVLFLFLHQLLCYTNTI